MVPVPSGKAGAVGPQGMQVALEARPGFITRCCDRSLRTSLFSLRLIPFFFISLFFLPMSRFLTL